MRDDIDVVPRRKPRRWLWVLAAVASAGLVALLTFGLRERQAGVSAPAMNPSTWKNREVVLNFNYTRKGCDVSGQAVQVCGDEWEGVRVDWNRGEIQRWTVTRYQQPTPTPVPSWQRTPTPAGGP